MRRMGLWKTEPMKWGLLCVDGANMSIWVEQIVRFMERLLQ